MREFRSTVRITAPSAASPAASSAASSAAWVVLTGLLLGGCALGSDGVNPRTGDAAGIDGGSRDGGMPPVGCSPPCAAGEVCRDGTCVPETIDLDGDGVPADRDCDDADSEVGTTAQRLCTTRCGEGLTDCAEGVWTECSAPTECSCELGAAPRDVPCGACGTQRQVCDAGEWVNEGGCAGEGVCAPDTVETRSVPCGACGEGTQVETRRCSTSCTFGVWARSGSCTTSATCAPGATDREERACSTTCGGTQSRTRTCSSSTCTWGTWSRWTACPSCPTCGDGVCGGTETCSTCADCQYGHLGTGDNGDSCAGVPAETWRCVYVARLGGNASQFCRGGVWTNYNLLPRDCGACVCSFSVACCQPGSTGTGCL